MTDAADEPSRTGAGALLREIVGSNRRFDDRLDTSPDITTREALTVMGRSLRLVAQARELFAGKFVLQLALMLPTLLLPWLAKIVVDNALQGLPFGTTEVAYPPFMTPILSLLEGKDPLGIMATITILYVVMLVTIGGPRRDDSSQSAARTGRSNPSGRPAERRQQRWQRPARARRVHGDCAAHADAGE